MKLTLGDQELEMNGKHLTELKASNDILEDTEALRIRLQEDGYLLIRNFHDREKVLQVRRDMLQNLSESGRLDSNYPTEEGIIGSGSKPKMFGGNNKDMPSLLEVVNAPRVIDFFARLFGGPAITLDYKWPRAMTTGRSSSIHYDIVYMGQGTKNLHTMWTPLGDVPLEMGGLAVCSGSHRFEKLKQTYGNLDVDKNLDGGGFTTDPIEIVDNFGGQWASTDYKAGDAIIFGMYMLHGSFKNQTNRYRTSCDTRYQLANEPIDERWVGEKPKGHSERASHNRKTIDEYKEIWGM